MDFERVLAIETSCDDTSVAVVEADGGVKALVSADQDLVHKPFGGIVPEIASRNHTMDLLPLVDKAFEQCGMSETDIDGLAVTSRPGLVGSLLVGLVTAKTLALSWNKPFVGINHLEAHLMAPFLRDENYAPPSDFTFPFIALAISGGHTHLYHVKAFGQYLTLGQTVDDAAGEAFDKFAKMLGLGFPGGIQIDRRSAAGDPQRFSFPRSMIKEKNYMFSFSGLKSSAQRMIQNMSEEEVEMSLADLCASYQEAIVDVLLAKLDRARSQLKLDRAVLTGGVSANSRLRDRAYAWAQKIGVQLVVPPPKYCTDNAAMVGLAGIRRLQSGERSSQTLGPSPRGYENDFIVLNKTK